MQIYGLKTCDTCRKALKALPESEFVDVRAQGLPDEVIACALAAFPADLVNRKSTTWRGLDDAARTLPAAQLLKAHPSLMKRPLIVAPGGLYLGWGPEVQASLLGNRG